MKLLKKELTVDKETLQPYLEVTILIPMEATLDNMALDANFYEKFGRQFFEELEPK